LGGWRDFYNPTVELFTYKSVEKDRAELEGKCQKKNLLESSKQFVVWGMKQKLLLMALLTILFGIYFMGVLIVLTGGCKKFTVPYLLPEMWSRLVI
jgi:hypothetical protein